MKITKKQKLIFSGLLVLFILLIIWIAFGLTAYQVKGEINILDKISYRLASITTAKPTVKLNVPQHYQEHSLSCEVASLLMTLEYRGVDVTETELIQQLPVSDPSPRGKNNIWGDPNLGFVGNIDGKMPNTGYGVYEKPINDLANIYRASKIITNGKIQDLIAELKNNNPVIVWGVFGKTKNISWKTPEGKTINAKNNEHTRVLIGFTGSSNNPQSLIFLDSIFGEVNEKTSDFIKNWKLLDNKAVVIY